MGEFKISIDPAHGLLRMVLSGFFSLENVAALDAERIAALAELGCAPNQHLTLCDVRAMQISSQDVVAAFTRIADDPDYISRRLAMVHNSSLARAQAKRVASRDTVAHFDDPVEAERWLLSGTA